MPTLPSSACVGFFGKLPSRGDFVGEGLPRDFTDSWDAWWQRGLAATQQRPREEWLAAWLEAPVWRFVLPPGLCGGQGAIGLWLPSVDKVGRYYPLTIAATAADDWAVQASALTGFLDAAELAGRDALELDLPPAELWQRVKDAFVADEATVPVDVVPGRAAWWTEGGPRVGPRLETGAVLPKGFGFAALIDDDWGTADPESAAAAAGGGEAS